MLQKSIIILTLLVFSLPAAAQEFEFVNNFLMNYSFVTGADRGMEQNLNDNLGWMVDQGYTHLRFFGIFPNGVHCFPSPTLDENGYPNSSYHEPVLELLVAKATQRGIVVNFDGWEVIAESNSDTTALGVGLITPAELGAIVQEVLDLGVTSVTEEQFGAEYLQAIQSATSSAGAIHETTACLWHQYAYAPLIADAQLVNIFNYFPRDQEEADSIIASGHGYDIPTTLGTAHTLLESPKYFGVHTSLAVGSFGTLRPESWKNILRFAEIQHRPDRLSIEEQDNDFMLAGEFNFAEYIGDELEILSNDQMVDRPIANLVIDSGTLYSGSFLPAWYALLVSAPAITGTFTSLGYKVITTVDSLLPEADMYYVLLSGGTDATNVAPLPDYVLTLLSGTKPVFIQPTYGIPDDNDSPDWVPLRTHFGLPAGETQTLPNEVPRKVTFGDDSCMWGGIELYLTPCVELLLTSQVDTIVAKIRLSGDVSGQQTALIIENGNSWLINSGVLHLEASYILSSLLGGRINAPCGADVVFAGDKALVFAEYSTVVDVDIPWSGTTRVTVYDPAGNLRDDKSIDLGGHFKTFLERGELIILGNLATSCCTGIRGNVNGDPSDAVNISDVTFLTAYLFGVPNGPAPTCAKEGNANGDPSESINISDVTYLVSYLFGVPNGPAPSNCP